MTLHNDIYSVLVVMSRVTCGAFVVIYLYYRFFMKKRAFRRTYPKFVEPTRVYNTECPICFLTTTRSTSNAIRLDCGHVYCMECLHELWRRSNWINKCALCCGIIDEFRLLQPCDDEPCPEESRRLFEKINKMAWRSKFTSRTEYIRNIAIFSFVFMTMVPIIIDEFLHLFVTTNEQNITGLENLKSL